MTDNVETTEVETGEEDTQNEVIRSMVDTILNGKASEAQGIFNSIVSAKVSDALDNRRVELSQTVFSRDSE
jgi:hypothetical protein